jgi:hypothetical protein
MNKTLIAAAVLALIVIAGIAGYFLVLNQHGPRGFRNFASPTNNGFLSDENFLAGAKKALGLPESAGIEELNNALGLPKDASIEQQRQAFMQKMRESRRRTP